MLSCSASDQLSATILTASAPAQTIRAALLLIPTKSARLKATAAIPAEAMKLIIGMVQNALIRAIRIHVTAWKTQQVTALWIHLKRITANVTKTLRGTAWHVKIRVILTPAEIKNIQQEYVLQTHRATITADVKKTMIGTARHAPISAAIIRVQVNPIQQKNVFWRQQAIPADVTKTITGMVQHASTRAAIIRVQANPIQQAYVFQSHLTDIPADVMKTIHGTVQNVTKIQATHRYPAMTTRATISKTQQESASQEATTLIHVNVLTATSGAVRIA